MKKCIVTVLGEDTVGIIAKVCTYLAENEINMMMIVDVANLKKDFKEVCDEMDVLGKEIGVTIHCQREEIFEKMHRL